MSETSDDQRAGFVLDGWVFTEEGGMTARIGPDAYTILFDTAEKADRPAICPKCGARGSMGKVKIETRSKKIMSVPAYGWTKNESCACSGAVPAGLDGVIEQCGLEALDLFLFMIVSPWRFLFKTVNYFFWAPADRAAATEHLRQIVAFFDAHGSPERFVTTGLQFTSLKDADDPTVDQQMRLWFLNQLRVRGITELMFRLLSLVREFVSEDYTEQRSTELLDLMSNLMCDIPFMFEGNVHVTAMDIRDFKQHEPVIAECDLPFLTTSGSCAPE